MERTLRQISTVEDQHKLLMGRPLLLLLLLASGVGTAPTAALNTTSEALPPPPPPPAAPSFFESVVAVISDRFKAVTAAFSGADSSGTDSRVRREYPTYLENQFATKSITDGDGVPLASLSHFGTPPFTHPKLVVVLHCGAKGRDLLILEAHYGWLKHSLHVLASDVTNLTLGTIGFPGD